MFDIVTDVYKFLKHHCIVKSQYDFSLNVLKRSPGYYGYLKSSGAEADIEAVLFAYYRVKGQRQNWESLGANSRLNKELSRFYKGLAVDAEQLYNRLDLRLSDRYVN